jgi:hypothetical protein
MFDLDGFEWSGCRNVKRETVFPIMQPSEIIIECRDENSNTYDQNGQGLSAFLWDELTLTVPAI